MSEPDFRAAFQAQVSRNMPATRSDCPSPEALNALASSSTIGDDATQAAQLEHILSCGACRPEFELLRAAYAAAMNASEAEQDIALKASPRRSFFTPQRVAIAASLMIAIGIAGEYSRRADDTIVRAGAGETADVALVSPAPGDPERNRGVFVWRSVAGAAAYNFEVLDSAGTMVVQATTSDTIVKLSPADSARVVALPVFDWMVTATRSDGNERRSPLTRIR